MSKKGKNKTLYDSYYSQPTQSLKQIKPVILLSMSIHSLEAFHYIIFHTMNFFGSCPNSYRAAARSQCYRTVGKKNWVDNNNNNNNIDNYNNNNTFRRKIIKSNGKKKINTNLQLVENKNILMYLRGKTAIFKSHKQQLTPSKPPSRSSLHTSLSRRFCCCYYSGSCAADVEGARGLPSAPYISSFPDSERKKKI